MIAKVFPTINGVVPYKSSQSTSYFSVYTTDTPYTVDFHGPQVSYHVFTKYSNEHTFDTGNKVWDGYVPIVKFYSGQSWPAEIAQNYYDGEQFGIYYYGKFITDKYAYSSATLQFMGQGRARYSTSYPPISSSWSEWIDLGVNRESIATVHLTTEIGAKGWTWLFIQYLSSNKYNNAQNSLVINSIGGGRIKSFPLSAGCYQSATEEVNGGVTRTNLSGIEQVTLGVDQAQTSKFTFSIPIVASTASFGYYYVEAGDYFQNCAYATQQIKKFRKIELHTGYDYSGTLSTITRFVGQVHGWSISRGAGGKASAVVECYDWSSFLSDKINEGYPDVSDYLAFDYIDKLGTSGVAGDSKPRCFDGWKLEDAIDCLLLNSYIDPEIIVQKRKVINVDDDVVDGGYSAYYYNNITSIILDKPLKYGSTLSVNLDQADGKYVWQFSMGNTTADCVKQLIDSYGLEYGFNNEGNFFVTSVKNPNQVKSIDEMSFTGSWEEEINAKMVAAVSNVTSVNADKVVATFVGVSSQLIFNRASTYGTIHVKLSNPTLGQIASVDVNSAHTSTRYYFNGVDDTVGYNPCILNIGSDLKYGSYSLNVTCKSNASVSINSVLIYDYDINTQADTFYTGDLGAERGTLIGNLGVKSSVSDVRNDIIVVGRLKGYLSSMAISDDEEVIVNPNNPTSEHVLARALDRNSLSSISNVNYTGRKLQTLIINPQFATEERAQWLATETARRYNELKKVDTPQISMIGHPLVEVGDKVGVHDVGLGVIATTQDCWVTGINTTQDSTGKYTTQLKLSSYEPWESFYRYPTPSLSRLGGSPITNLYTYNTGLPLENDQYCRISTAQGATPGTIKLLYINLKVEGGTSESIVAKLERAIPNIGYLKYRSEVIKYTNVSVSLTSEFEPVDTSQVSAAIELTGLTRGMFNTDESASLIAGDKVEMQVSPYITEDAAISPAIQFDLLYPGRVKIHIYSSGGDIVDILTGSPDVFDQNAGWEFLQPGTYVYSWGMVDRSGVHNTAVGGRFVYSGDPTLDQPGKSTTVLGDWLDSFGPQDPNNGEAYRIAQGYYAWNDVKKKYGKFFFDFEYKDPTLEIMSDTFNAGRVTPICTVLRPGGTGVAVSGKPYEYFVFDSWSDGMVNTNKAIDFDQDRLSYEWIGSNGLPLAYHENYKQYYYSSDVLFRFKNKYRASRIVNLQVERKIAVLLTYHFPNGKSSTSLVETYIEPIFEDAGLHTVISNSKYTQMLIPAPALSFVTPEVRTHLDKNIVVDFQGNKPTQVSLTHLHLFKIVATDYSGRKDTCGCSLFWVPSGYISTPSNIKKAYDQRTPNWPVRLGDGAVKVISDAQANLAYPPYMPLFASIGNIGGQPRPSSSFTINRSFGIIIWDSYSV